MNVYLVMDGNYEATVLAIFSTKEIAERFISDTKEPERTEQREIEEWKVDEKAGYVLRTVYQYCHQSKEDYLAQVVGGLGWDIHVAEIRWDENYSNRGVVFTQEAHPDATEPTVRERHPSD